MMQGIHSDKPSKTENKEMFADFGSGITSYL